MKVVILHQHFNIPSVGGGIRSWYLARALADKGAEVVVVTAHNKKTYLKTNIDGIEVHYLPVPYDNRFGFGARSIAFLRYAWKSVRLFKQFKKTNVCYAISAPLTVGLAALWIKKKYGVPFLFEVGDLWPAAPEQMGFVRNYFLLGTLYALEKKIYKQADGVIALSTAIQSAIENTLPGKKVYLIPNMADCDFFQPELKDPKLEDKFKVRNKFVVSYTGAFGFANGLEYFLQCASQSQDHKLPIHFILCGGGAMREKLEGEARRLGLSNLSIVEFQNRDGVKEILNITDAAFVCYKRVPVLETGSPNKLFDGLAAGKLIIVNFGGWIRSEIEENGCGFYSDPEQPGDFVNKISRFLESDDLVDQYQRAARGLAERKYSRRTLCEQFVEVIESHYS